MFKKTIFLILILFVCLLASWPLLTRGFIPTHDGEYHLIRFFEFDKSIRAGNFFPRWASGLNSGLGAPIFNFFYPLPNYIAEGFHLLGFSFIISFNLTMTAGIFLGGLFFYFWLKNRFGFWPAMVGSFFYTLAPYHLLDVYVRGSVGEVLALGFFPAILWAVDKKSKWFSVFLALLILSHNILAMIFMPFLISYILLLKKRNKIDFRYLFFNFLIGLGLSCFFWLPALLESKYVVGLKMIDFRQHFPDFFQLILPSWGTGFSVAGISDGMSFQIGLPHLFSLFLILILIKKKNILGKFFLGWFFLIMFFLLESSLFFWNLIPFFDFIQFPWRMLSLTALVSSFLVGYLVYEKKTKWLGFFLLFLAVVLYLPYARPVKYLEREDSFYFDNDLWFKGTATLGNTFNTNWLAYPLEGDIGFETQQLEIAYFPGWEVRIDGELLDIFPQNGLINFRKPLENQKIEVKFKKTPIRKLAEWISLLALFFLAGRIMLEKLTKDENSD